MALLMVMTVCLLVYAALEYRIRTALQEHGATFPDQKGRRMTHPSSNPPPGSFSPPMASAGTATAGGAGSGQRSRAP